MGLFLDEWVYFWAKNGQFGHLCMEFNHGIYWVGRIVMGNIFI